MIPIFFISALATASISYFFKNKTISRLMLMAHLVMLIALNVHEYYNRNQTEDNYFRADALGLIFLTVMTILSITTVFHSFVYNEKRHEKVRNVDLHNSGLIVFTASMAGVLISTHLGLLWAFVEATTLAAAILIYHNRSNLALEATWKYVFVCSIGIALAFAGILFLGMATKDVKNFDFSIDIVKNLAPQMNPVWLKVSFLFVLTGFSVKMGIVPLFNVDIDAKDVAPSPVGALLSSCLMNVGFVSIFRFYECFANTEILAFMNKSLQITGVMSLFFAAVYLLKVQNYKRAFAYSSMEHASLVAIALSIGGVGYFAAILHLILHSFAKASLFYQIGQVYRVYDSKHEDNVGGYMKINPYGGVVLLLGLAAVLAMPPFGLFVSEFMIFKALALQENWIILFLVMALLSVIVYSMGKKFLHLLFGNNHLLTQKTETYLPHDKPHPFETCTQFALLGFVLYCGIVQPEFLVEYINLAVANLIK